MLFINPALKPETTVASQNNYFSLLPALAAIKQKVSYRAEMECVKKLLLCSPHLGQRKDRLETKHPSKLIQDSGMI